MSAKDFSVVGTTYWRSYALFIAGSRRETEGDLDAAETLYVEALKLDPGNRGARVNFAGVLLNGGERHRGIEQLRQAMAEAERARGGDADPVYYAAAMRLAATLYNVGKQSEALAVAEGLLARIGSKLLSIAKPPELTDLPQKALNFVGLERVARLRIARRHSVMRDTTFEKYLTSLIGPLHVMVLGLRVANDKYEAADELDKIDKSAPSAALQYNLACTLAIVAEHTKNDDRAQEALSHLAFALRLQRRPKELLERDKSLSYLRTERYERDFGNILTRCEPKPRAGHSYGAAAVVPPRGTA